METCLQKTVITVLCAMLTYATNVEEVGFVDLGLR